MNVSELTKHIVEGLLGEDAKKDIAIYAGSFRPPTKSDYNLLLKAVEENPGIDQIHVFVGDSESEGLDQDDSVAIWKMFGNHFPRDLYVHKSAQSPVKDVYAYASKYPTYDINWLFGAREGNSDDFKEIADRTKSVGKFKNVSISPILFDNPTTEREVAAAAGMGTDELQKYLPDNLTYKEIDAISDMLKTKQLDEAVHQYTDDIINKIAEEGWEYYETMGNLPSKAAKVAKQARKEKKKLFTLAYERDSSSDPVIQYINVFWADGGNPSRDVIEGGTMQDYEDIRDAGQLYLQEVDTDDLAKFEEVVEKIVEGGVNFYAMISPRFHGSKVIEFLKKEEARVNQPQFAIQNFKNGAVVLFSDGTRFTLADIDDQDIQDLKDAGDINVQEVATADLAKYETVVDKISQGGYEYYPAEDLSPESFKTQLMLNASKQKKKLFTITQNVSGGGMWNLDAPKQYSTTVYLATPDSTDVETSVIHNTTKEDLEDLLGAAGESLDTVIKEAYNQPRFEELLNKIAEGDYYYVPAEDLDSLGRLEMRQVRYDHDYDIDKPMFSFALRRGLPQDIGARFSDEPDNQFWILDATKEEVQDLRDTVEMFTSRIPKEKLVLKEAKNIVDFEDYLNRLADGDYYYVPTLDADSIYKVDMRHARLNKNLDLDKPLFSYFVDNYTKRGEKKRDLVFVFSDHDKGHYTIAEDIDENDLEGLEQAVELFTKPIPARLMKEAVKFEYDPVHGLDHYEDLMRYMSKNGLNIEPFPEIKFVDDDADNAEDLFGKTAYYDPNNKSVVLYTYGRHPKDIMRSFAHELVHVHQDNEGRIGNIQTTNTNEDDDLVELEKEAYLKGNILFRQWTDSLNEKKKEYGIDAYAAELARLRENIDKKAQKKHKGKSSPYGSAYEPVKEDTDLKAFTAKVNPFQIYCDINHTLTNGSDPLQWTEDGIRLWEYIRKYDPILLSNDENCNQKIIWIKASIPNLKQYIFINKNKKQEYARPDTILIDNRSQTIDNWNEAGGMGILFTDADDVIRQLQQLGL